MKAWLTRPLVLCPFYARLQAFPSLQKAVTSKSTSCNIQIHAVDAQEGLVPFNIGVRVVGDVTVGLWFGSYNLGQRLHSRPAAAFAFHTAFVDESVQRITMHQLDVPTPGLFPPEAARRCCPTSHGPLAYLVQLQPAVARALQVNVAVPPQNLVKIHSS